MSSPTPTNNVLGLSARRRRASPANWARVIWAPSSNPPWKCVSCTMVRCTGVWLAAGAGGQAADSRASKAQSASDIRCLLANGDGLLLPEYEAPAGDGEGAVEHEADHGDDQHAGEDLAARERGRGVADEVAEALRGADHLGEDG